MSKAKTGRPRSEKAREAVINAVDELLEEKGGGAMSIEGIARHAGVGKPTIYRWWPSLADIVLEAVLGQAGEAVPVPEYESLEKSLGVFLCSSMEAITAGGGEHLRFLMAQAQKDNAFRERFREKFVSRRRSVLRSLLIQAQECTDIGPDQDLEILVDMIFGAMWYRLLVGHGSMDAQFAYGLVSVVKGSCV